MSRALEGERVRSHVGTGPNGGLGRHPEDWYRTSPEAILPFLEAERFPGVVWEPACGDGAISRILLERPEVEAVVSTDLVDRGYGRGGIDFLALDRPPKVGYGNSDRRPDHVLTNPPYSLAVDFALKVLANGWLPPGGKLALFCRTLWLEGSRRHERLFRWHPPARVYVHRRRIPMARGDLPMRTGLISFSWFVWESAATNVTELRWL